MHDLLLCKLQERGIIDRHGVRVQVLGDLSRLPANVAAAAHRCMVATAHQTRCVLNICLAYT
jgi:ditrans,polycis-polyprenyl diphosphate synthase